MRKLVAPAIGAIATVVLLTAPGAEAESQYVDLRVVTNDDQTLADQRQYTDDVKFKASEDADCFGPSNPSSDESYELNKPTALGALVDASKKNSNLKPLLITDAFFGGFGSFGVCGVGNAIAGDAFGEPYWYSAANGEGATTGPNLIKAKDGDRHLWYLATGSEAAISELRVDAPYEVSADEAFTVTVTRLLPDGSTEPAEGAIVNGGAGPTNSNGETTVTPQSGFSSLYATGGAEDVISDTEEVCATDGGLECPKAAGIAIFGSPGDDEIKSAKGADEITCGKGKDTVIRKKSDKGDDIANDCEKVVKK